MLVKAKRTGYYDLKRRREGDVFQLKEVSGFKKVGDRMEKVMISAKDQFTDTWMEMVDGDEDEGPKKQHQPLRERKSLREASKEVI